MKTLAALLQISALAACLSAQLAASGEMAMPGMRRALQTINAAIEQAVRPQAPVLLSSSR